MTKPSTQNSPEPRPKLSFYCLRPCGHRFKAEPESYIEKNGEQVPAATCPACENLAAQAAWEINLFKTTGTQTGPKTAEGKAKTAANLEGYPTEEQKQHTRLNALKHGAFAKTAQFFPARPGQYARCNTCTVDPVDCISNRVCISKSEVFMRHQIAQETDNPSLLRALQADNQANIQIVLEDLFLNIASNGAMFKTPKTITDFKTGTTSAVEIEDEDSGEKIQIFEHTANPAVKLAIELMNKNGMTLADLGMTPRSQGEVQQLKGNLSGESTGALEAAKEMRASMGDLKDLLNRGKLATNTDPVLVEYNEEQGGSE